eukprot:3228620-Pyramimonas_sp.AAC.1
MFEICDRSCASSALASLRAWIDDVTQRAEGLKRDVIRELIQAGAVFASGCDQEHLNIASKSTIVASGLSVA